MPVAPCSPGPGAGSYPAESCGTNSVDEWLNPRVLGAQQHSRGEEGEVGCAGAGGRGPATRRQGGVLTSKMPPGAGPALGRSPAASTGRPAPSTRCLHPQSPQLCGWKENREAVRTGCLPTDSEPRAPRSNSLCPCSGPLNSVAIA